MKYQAVIPLLISALSLFFSTQVFSAKSDTDGAIGPRWFEVEVILFKHKSKQSITDEIFSTKNLEDEKQKSLDLLTPFIQPNISALKKMLPICGQKKPQFPFDISNVPVEMWVEENAYKTIVADINKEATRDTRHISIRNNIPSNTEVTTHTASKMSIINLPEHDKSAQQVTVGAKLPPFTNIELLAYTQFIPLEKQAFCIIPTSVLKQNLNEQQLAQYNVDSIPIKALPKIISGVEQWRANEIGEITWASNKPYLINQDSLKLKSINNRIKRSRDYAPLLHLGWRQVGESKRKAKALNLFAGENLSLIYQESLAQQKSKLNAIELQTILDQRIADKLAHLQTALNEKNSSEINELSQEEVATSPESNNNNVQFNEQITAVGDILATEINEGVTNEDINLSLSPEEQSRLQAQQEQLNLLFKEFSVLQESQLDITTNESESESELQPKAITKPSFDESTIQQVVEQLSASLNAEEQDDFDGYNGIEKVVIPPIQPWTLDGLFNIHLDHYIYINAELNIVDEKQKVKHGTVNKDSVNLIDKQPIISFKQSRRVITGEIHYFDHPHIGMIVQIRRFDPTKPAVDAVTQSIKSIKINKN